MPQGSTLVQSDMVGFVAFNLVLRIVRTRVMEIAFVIHIPYMHTHDAPADPACFGIPTHVIADFEYPRHHDSPKTPHDNVGMCRRSGHSEFQLMLQLFHRLITRCLFAFAHQI
jgi:hypothetical protein